MPRLRFLYTLYILAPGVTSFMRYKLTASEEIILHEFYKKIIEKIIITKLLGQF